MTKLFFIISIFITHSCFADIHVITHTDNPIQQLSQDEIRDLYMGRSKAFPNGEFASVFDRKEDSEIRARFFKHIAGMRLRQIDAFWARLVFAGRMLPLEKVEHVSDLERRIAENKNAIGYINQSPESENLKTIYVIKAP